MISLDRLPFLRRVHDDGIISLAERHDRFMDWINPIISAGLSNPYSLIGNKANPSYGPLAYLLLRPISGPVTRNASQVHPNASMNLAGIFTWTLVATASIWITTKMMASIGRAHDRLDFWSNISRGRLDPLCLSYILLSYPTLFAFDRGNLELAMLPIISAYIYCTFHQIQNQDTSKTKTYPRAILLTVAACIKPYLLIFSLYNPYFISASPTSRSIQKGIRWILCIGLAAALASLIALSLLSNGQPDIGGLLEAQKNYFTMYVEGDAGNIWYLSPYTLFKKLLLRQDILKSIQAYTTIYAFLYGLAGVLMLRTALSLKSGLMIRSIVSLSVIILMLLTFPSLSNEYKAVYVVIPVLMGLQIRDANQPGASLYSDRLFIISTALCLFISTNRYSLIGDIRATSALSSLVLTVFTIIFAVASFTSQCGHRFKKRTA